MDVGHDLERVIHGRRWLIVFDTLTGAKDVVALLQAHGAAGIAVVAGSRGVGEVPDTEVVPTFVLDMYRPTMMESLRAWGRLLHDLPEDVVAFLDEWDPDRAALVLGAGMTAATHVAGRRIYGPRRAEWMALEDKLLATELWAAAGINQAPFTIVAATADALARAHAEMRGPLGSVWVADNRTGWHGGAEYLRWVTDSTAEAIEFMAANAHQVRVMPFLDGIPCSIHGFVGPGGVAVFRPVEMLVLRDLSVPRLAYGSVATRWDPAESDRAEMRAIARRVGEHLRQTVEYRGAFGIDGVMTVDGFLPTELNARTSAGTARQLRSVPGCPVGFFNRAWLEGDLPGLDLEAFEAEVIRNADAQRSTRVFMPTMSPPPGERRMGVAIRSDTVVPAADESAGVMELGIGPPGAILRVDFAAGSVPPGPPLGPLAARAVGLADEIWDLGLGELSAAPDLRPRTIHPSSGTPAR